MKPRPFAGQLALVLGRRDAYLADHPQGDQLIEQRRLDEQRDAERRARLDRRGVEAARSRADRIREIKKWCRRRR